MCGICGIVELDGRPAEPDLVAAMASTLRHRGPDDIGVFTDRHVGLGHTRLSIIDLTAAGHQPMASPDNDVVISFNGEIYNFRELRADLEGAGVRFSGRSDTEVALKAYIAWGEAAFARFNGMFAIALWDRRTQTLLLVRDLFGIKPLYYFQDRDRIVFGSEIKALLASRRVPRGVDRQAFHEYLHYGTGLGERTCFEDVKKLLPGHLLRATGSAVEAVKYAEFAEPMANPVPYEEATVRARELLEAAVQRQLVSDVPVGVFLSGGLDSSAVAQFAARHYDGRLRTYTAGFDFEDGVNELPNARLVADAIGSDHHELHVSAPDVPALLQRLVRCHDAPFGDAANIPLFLLCEQLRGDVKVILQGDGGDEIFAGYRRYARLSHVGFYRTLRPLVSLVGSALPEHGALHRAIRTIEAVSHPDASSRMARLMSPEFSNVPPERVLSAEMRHWLLGTDPFDRYRQMDLRFRHLDPVQRMLYTDASIILPDVFLEKVDKPTMANSIEVRVPMLDNHLAGFVMGLPSSYKVSGRETKRLLRRALRGVVPETIRSGPKKGFGVPFQHWLRTTLADYLKSVVLDPSSNADGWFDRKQLTECIQQHVSGERDNGFLLYHLLNLCLWRACYL
jgi:asparagine synthase (glutamine-hydrolysing)